MAKGDAVCATGAGRRLRWQGADPRHRGSARGDRRAHRAPNGSGGQVDPPEDASRGSWRARGRRGLESAAAELQALCPARALATQHGRGAHRPAAAGADDLPRRGGRRANYPYTGRMDACCSHEDEEKVASGAWQAVHAADLGGPGLRRDLRRPAPAGAAGPRAVPGAGGAWCWTSRRRFWNIRHKLELLGILRRHGAGSRGPRGGAVAARDRSGAEGWPTGWCASRARRTGRFGPPGGGVPTRRPSASCTASIGGAFDALLRQRRTAAPRGRGQNHGAGRRRLRNPRVPRAAKAEPPLRRGYSLRKRRGFPRGAPAGGGRGDGAALLAHLGRGLRPGGGMDRPLRHGDRRGRARRGLQHPGWRS